MVLEESGLEFELLSLTFLIHYMLDTNLCPEKCLGLYVKEIIFNTP